MLDRSLLLVVPDTAIDTILGPSREVTATQGGDSDIIYSITFVYYTVGEMVVDLSPRVPASIDMSFPGRSTRRGLARGRITSHWALLAVIVHPTAA